MDLLFLGSVEYVVQKAPICPARTHNQRKDFFTLLNLNEVNVRHCNPRIWGLLSSAKYLDVAS